MSSEIIEKIKEFQIYPLSNFNQELQDMINGSYMEAIKNNLSKQLFSIDIPNNPLNIKKVSNIKQRLFGMKGGSDEEIVMEGGANKISGKDLINYVTEKIQNNPLLEMKCIYTIFKLISSFYDYKCTLIGTVFNLNTEHLSHTIPDLYYPSQINKPSPAVPKTGPIPVAQPVAFAQPVSQPSKTVKDKPWWHKLMEASVKDIRPRRRRYGGGLDEENPNSFETLDYINSSIANDTLEILKVYFEYIYCLYFQNPNNELLKDLINIVLIQNLEFDENEIKYYLYKHTEFNSLHSIYNNIIENTKDSVTLGQRIFGKSKLPRTAAAPTLYISPEDDYVPPISGPISPPAAWAPRPESPQPSEQEYEARRFGGQGMMRGGSNMNNRWFEAALNTTNKVNVIPTIQKMSGAQGGLDSPGRLDGTINMLSDKILSN